MSILKFIYTVDSYDDNLGFTKMSQQQLSMHLVSEILTHKFLCWIQQCSGTILLPNSEAEHFLNFLLCFDHDIYSDSHFENRPRIILWT